MGRGCTLALCALLSCHAANPDFDDSEGLADEVADGQSRDDGAATLDSGGEGTEYALDCSGCGAVRLDARTFCLCPARATWLEGAADCELRGGTLASVHDARTNARLAELGAKLVGGTGPDFWIGLHDPDRNGSWTWLDGQGHAFTNWRDGAPGDGDRDEACVEIQLTNAKWNDSPCSSRQDGYICARLPAS